MASPKKAAPKPDDKARTVAGQFASFDRHRRVYAQNATLGTADLRLLWLLSDGEPRTLRDIAQQLNLEQSTVNRQVNAAINGGLLRRQRHGSADPYLFTQSAEGAAAFERNLVRSLVTYRAGIDALGEDAEQFMSLFERFIEGFGQAATELS